MKRFVREYANYTKNANKGWIIDFHGKEAFVKYCRMLDAYVKCEAREQITVDEAMEGIRNCERIVDTKTVQGEW